MTGDYPVITLCGSTRFRKEFETAQKQLTLAGIIVISVGLFGHAGDEEVWEGMDEGAKTRTKTMLDDMHKRKIDMADGIFVINKDGYIGDSTRSEIVYAASRGKLIRYLEEEPEKICPCCGKFFFSEKNAWEICPVCGWEDDPSQRRDPDLAGGANRLSLREAKTAYQKESETKA